MSSPVRRLLALMAAVTAVISATPVAALAHDAPMPDGARHGLIVDERWVMLHWAPFDEREAERALALKPGQLAAFLYNDHHTIAQLAKHRGIGFEPLVDRLAAWSDDTPGADPDEIRQRVRLMLVSGHLAQHVLGHVFHGMASTSVLQKEVELTQPQFAAKRAEGRSYRTLIRAAGNDAAAVQYRLSKDILRNQQRGVRRHETPARQAKRMGDRQHDLLPCWFRRPAQLVDPAAPYGREYLKHVPGHTAAEIPTTRAEQAEEDRVLEGYLSRRPPSCWPLPQRFSSDPGAPLSRTELRALARVPDGFKGPVNDQLDHPDAGDGDGDEHTGHDMQEHAGH